MSYFKVGEECILQSQSEPQLNGDCNVIKVLAPMHRRVFSANGKCEYMFVQSYVLSIENPNGRSWSESALRKKHKPSTESLSTIIEELNKAKV
jgi:hypothetical protein